MIPKHQIQHDVYARALNFSKNGYGNQIALWFFTPGMQTVNALEQKNTKCVFLLGIVIFLLAILKLALKIHWPELINPGQRLFLGQ